MKIYYPATVRKMTDRELHDELTGHPPRRRSRPYLAALRGEQIRRETDLRSHEPPRNSGEGTAVNGPMPLEGESDALEPD